MTPVIRMPNQGLEQKRRITAPSSAPSWATHSTRAYCSEVQQPPQPQVPGTARRRPNSGLKDPQMTDPARATDQKAGEPQKVGEGGGFGTTRGFGEIRLGDLF
jgi:hypothetical protein